MKSLRGAILPAAVALALLPAAAGAQEMILEAETGTEALAYCDMLHSIKTCVDFHVETQVALSTGAVVQLDGEDYVVDWIGPGYYLETGVVIEPAGKLQPDLKGQRWVEVYPDEGKVHTSRGWHDKDLNLALTAADTLALDGEPEVTVKDVRLHLRVSPAGAKARPERRTEPEKQ